MARKKLGMVKNTNENYCLHSARCPSLGLTLRVVDLLKEDKAPLPEDSSCWLFFAHTENPLSEALLTGLVAELPAETSVALARFKHPVRYQEAVLGRALSELLARLKGYHLKEELPYSPLLLRSSTNKAATLTLAHNTYLGKSTVLASLGELSSTRPALAVDVEAMRERANIPELLAHSFAPEIAKRIAGAMEGPSQEDRLSLFYRAWGEHECAVKLNRGENRFRVEPHGAAWAVVKEGKEALTTHTICFENTLFTLVGEKALFALPVLCAQMSPEVLLELLRATSRTRL